MHFLVTSDFIHKQALFLWGGGQSFFFNQNAATLIAVNYLTAIKIVSKMLWGLLCQEKATEDYILSETTIQPPL